ncbi:hypothetical protein FisN_7Hu030 [Fistulifera solaris]|uniref:Uncharacterized protein n=1 Tax=Fistulifera solaris TaxID=1519565 RepID=A0A1Z5K3S2_FISSO|nr:hypothetical protein FisN_7Hu030 [Fistulifera solaris]|eukprot:GAX20721.1 hypothetical protein FisN_7Hu030 [Fistulifera solaris]
MFRPVAPVLGATGKQFVLKRNHRVFFQVSFVLVLFLMLIGVVAACGAAQWIGASAVGLYLLLAELRRSSAATKLTHHSVRLRNLEAFSSIDLDRIRLLRKFRCRSTPSTQQSASKQEVHSFENRVRGRRRRVRFAPGDQLCSFVLIKPYYEMSAEELASCYDGRFMSKEFTDMKSQEVKWERQFEVFPSDDESAFCKHTYWKFEKHIPAFSEELFFVDEKGEKCHPAHWTAFSIGLLPYLRKSAHVPPGFSSWASYERHLLWYNEFYHTCIMWYDYHFCGVPVEPLPQDVEDTEGGAGDAEVDDHANAEDNFNADDDGSVGYHADSFPGIEAAVEDRGCVGSRASAPTAATLVFVDEVKEEDHVIDTDTGVEDTGDEVVGLGEEVDAVTVVPPTRKVKAFGPCNRTRPYLGRRCKENIQYTK